MRIFAIFLSISLFCAGCVQTIGGDPVVQPAPVQQPTPSELSVATPATGGSPDASCAIASDCVVKDVGNCCGYFPACVNKDSKVDPEAVRAECARTGTSSICGFADIQACDCVQGQCRAINANPLETER